MNEKIQLLTILQVSERLKIPKHTLRFWEKEFNGLLVPLRTQGGQRRYTPENILILEEIKKARDGGLGLPEIMEKINQKFKTKFPHPSKIDLLANRVADVVRTEVYNFFQEGEQNG